MTYVHESHVEDVKIVRETLKTYRRQMRARSGITIDALAALARLEARIEELELGSDATPELWKRRQTVIREYKARAEVAEARIERLEGALREIEFGSVLRLGGRANLSREEMQQIARAALAEEPRLAYQWFRCDADGGNREPIPRATKASYTLTEEDVGRCVQRDASRVAEEPYADVPGAGQRGC